MTETTSHELTVDEVAHFGREGFVGPFTLCAPEEMETIRKRIEEDVLTTPSPYPVHHCKDRHLDSRVIWELCSHPAIRDRMKGVLGPDLLLFASSLFVKEARPSKWYKDPPFPWHCDAPYWPMAPVVGITAWLAITEATTENGCVSLIPRSHRKSVPHTSFGYFNPLTQLKARLGLPVITGQRAKTRAAGLDESTAVCMTIKPGQFFLFTESTVHTAGGNQTDRQRIGLAVRVTVPLVRIRHDEIFEDHRAVLLGGQDRFGWNRITSPPN
ncbi:MAG: phytanoyl-CoA dioxygenase family protein [Acidobacteria bacterium]|nr:phytanoyl-CoA dioxygenase family protein [Acidobacteriota bacterium]